MSLTVDDAAIGQTAKVPKQGLSRASRGRLGGPPSASAEGIGAHAAERGQGGGRRQARGGHEARWQGRTEPARAERPRWQAVLVETFRRESGKQAGHGERRQGGR